MKKVLFGLAVVAVAAFGTYRATQTSNDVALSDLQVENLEALGGGDNPPFCPWGVAEYYVAKEAKYNGAHSAFCDCTPITYMIARRQCDGKELCDGSSWNSIVKSGNY